MGYVKEIVAGDSTHLVEPILYGTCAAAADENKTVALSNFELVTGVTIHVKFTNSNTKSDATLNVNSQGAKPIIRYNDVPVGTNAKTSWVAGSVVSFTYDGTNWVMNTGIDSNDNTTYSNGSGISIGSGNAINHTNSVTA